MSGEPRGTPPDPAGIGAGGPSPAGGNPQPPAGRQPGQPTDSWDALLGWDDDPDQRWDEQPASEPWDAVQPRRGWPPPAGGAPVGGWRDRPAVRAGLLGLAVVLAMLAAASAWPGGSREPGARPPAATAGGGPGRARPAYGFAPPAGWRDGTRGLAPRFPGARPDVVLVGPASGGLGANLSVVRAGAIGTPPPLAALPGAAVRRLDAGARLVGHARWLTLAGEPAVAADYLLTTGGGRLHARQVACYHQGDLYLVTLTAEAGAFPSVTSAQDRVVRSWRWT
ncbi:MAG TPA: hypothetical protein VF486_05570 [Actinomycetes bacterium]